MRVGMIADDVASRGHFAREFGKSADVFSGEKKCAASVVAFEQIEQRGSDGGIRAIVEGERESGRISRSTQSRAEDLRARVDGAPGCDSSASKHKTAGDNRRTHVSILAWHRI